jgi:hypothetical protein
MKRRFLLFTFLAVCIGIGFGTACSRAGMTTRLAVQQVATQSMAAQEEVTPTFLLKEIVAKAHPTALSGLNADQLVQELNARAVAGLLSGWVHIQVNKNIDTDLQNSGILPNGNAIPNRQIMDIWYHLNAERLVIEGVTIMRTTDGQIVQVGVCSNDTSWNSGTDDITTSEPYIVNGFDYGFLKNDLQWLEGFGNTAVITQVILPSGGEGVQVVIDAEYEKPIVTNDFNKPTTRAETRAVFDSTTGYLVSREVTVWFVDGSQRVFNSLNQKISFESPTDEVLNLLSENGWRVKK